jgi:hypothetical protein
MVSQNEPRVASCAAVSRRVSCARTTSLCLWRDSQPESTRLGERGEAAPPVLLVEDAGHQTGTSQAGHEVGDAARGEDHPVSELGHARSALGRVEQRDQCVELLERDPMCRRERVVERTGRSVGEHQAAVPRAELGIAPPRTVKRLDSC